MKGFAAAQRRHDDRHPDDYRETLCALGVVDCDRCGRTGVDPVYDDPCSQCGGDGATRCEGCSECGAGERPEVLDE